MQAAAAAAATPRVVEEIQRALANGSKTSLYFAVYDIENDPPPLTNIDARLIMECLRENPHKFDTLDIYHYSLHDDADVLNAFRVGLPLCTSVKTVKLEQLNLENEDLDCLRPAFYNTYIRILSLYGNNIQGGRGGDVLRDLLVDNETLRELILSYNCIGPEGSVGLGGGMTGNNWLQILHLYDCEIGNKGVANLVTAFGQMKNNSLTDLYLCSNHIEHAEGGRQVGLLLQRCPKIKVLSLDNNYLGPLGARALAPGLATASHLESLELYSCGLGNDGVANLIPDGQVNRSLTNLDLRSNHYFPKKFKLIGKYARLCHVPKRAE